MTTKAETTKREAMQTFEEIIKLKSVTLFIPHFNKNVRLQVRKNFVDESDRECFELKGKVNGNTVMSETIFCQKDLDEMTHIFKHKQ